MTTQMNSSGIMPQFRGKPDSCRHAKNTGLDSTLCQNSTWMVGGVGFPRLVVDPGLSASYMWL